MNICLFIQPYFKKAKPKFLGKKHETEPTGLQKYTDENGAISIKVKETDRKHAITFHREGRIRSSVLTMNKEELEKFVESANKLETVSTSK